LANGENGNGGNGVHVMWKAAIAVALAAGGVNTGMTAMNPAGERLARLESQMATMNGESAARVTLFTDVGEIKADMRWLREAVAEIKQEVKARP